MVQESLGDRVRSWRVRQGMSQAQLALPELSDSYVSLIESGKRTPAPDVVRLLARKLGCSASYLTSGVDDVIVDGLRTTVQYAQIALENGEAAEARARYAEALASPDLTVLPTLMRDARWGYARALEATGAVDEAIAEMRRLADDTQPNSDQSYWTELHIALCRCYRERGDLAESIRTGEEALGRLTSTGARWTDGMVMLGVTVLAAYEQRGDLVYALQLTDRLIKHAETVGSPRALMSVLWNGAWVAEARGKVEDAFQMSERALALLGEEDDPGRLGRLRNAFAHFLLAAYPEEAEQARSILRKAERELATSSAGAVHHAWCLVYQAQAEIVLDNPREAATLAERAIDVLGDTVGLCMADALAALGEAYVRLDRKEDAINALTTAAGVLEKMQATRQAGQVWYRLSELLASTGQAEGQSSAMQQALVCMGL